MKLTCCPGSLTVPPEHPRLIGRDNEFHKLIDWLIDEHHVAVAGVGGIGKSSLASAAWNDGRVRKKFRYRLFFPLHGVQSADALLAELYKYVTSQ